jgi:hypothetical protein
MQPGRLGSDCALLRRPVGDRILRLLTADDRATERVRVQDERTADCADLRYELQGNLENSIGGSGEWR